MFNSIFDTSTAGMEINTALIAAAAAIGMGLVLAITQMLTAKSSKGFLVTLTVLPVLVFAVMVMINGNLGTSIAILGAFSLVRFRSIRGSARDLLAIFFSMMIGLACGMGHVMFGAVMTLIAVVAIVVFHFLPLFDTNKRERVLKIVIPEDLDYGEVFNDICRKYTARAELVTMRTVNMGSLYDLTYNVRLKNSTKEKQMLDEIREKNCNLKVSLSQPMMEEEL